MYQQTCSWGWKRGSSPLPERGWRCGRPQPKRAIRPAAWLWNGLRSGGSGGKVLHLVRHGETEMNVHLSECYPSYGEPGFVDPMLHDTRLTRNGRAQAAAAAARIARLRPAPEVVVVSPLTRALQTADLACEGLFSAGVPRMVQPLAAERLYLSSDVGRVRGQLESEFPHYCFKEVPEGCGREAVWWHSSSESSSSSDSEGEFDLLAVEEEPEDVFLRRMERLRQWLAARPESCLTLVSHWGVLQALTGIDFYNCEVRSVQLRQLRARPQLLERERQEAASVQ